MARLGTKTLFIEPGSPWENGYIESFNGKLRDPAGTLTAKGDFSPFDSGMITGGGSS